MVLPARLARCLFTAARTRLVRLSALTLLTASLAGCTPFGEYVQNKFKVGPNYLKPPAPVETDWIDAADVRLRKETADLSHWWTVFNDPVLNGLVDNAYAQNLTLKEAGFRVLQARYALAIQRGSLFPQQQDVSGDITRNAISTETANAFAVRQRFFDQSDVGFNLSWELDLWGRFRRAIESADADLNASVENYDDVLVTLLGDVASTYIQIRTLQRELVLVRTNVELQQQTLTIANARFRGGQTSELDVDQSQSTLSQTEAQIPAFEIQLRQATNRLCILLGMPPQDLSTLLGAGQIPSAPPEVVVGIPADLLSRRPDIRRAERTAAAQSAQIGVAEAELYPHIAITGTVGASAEDFSNLFNQRAMVASIGPSFQWNILNYGRLRNNVRLQDAAFQELVVTYQNTVLSAQEEVENGIVAFLQSQQQARYLAESVTAAEKAVKVAIVQYRAGTVDFNRVALLQQNLVQQQDQLAQSQGAIAIGLVQVYRALGGGWQLRLNPNGVTEFVEAPGEPAPAPPALEDQVIPAPKPELPPAPQASRGPQPEPRFAQAVVRPVSQQPVSQQPVGPALQP